MKKIQKLEEQILDCWRITDDLDTLFEAVLDTGLSPDQISNILLGIKDLYSLKFEKTFHVFEELVAEYYGSSTVSK